MLNNIYHNIIIIFVITLFFSLSCKNEDDYKYELINKIIKNPDILKIILKDSNYVFAGCRELNFCDSCIEEKIQKIKEYSKSNFKVEKDRKANLIKRALNELIPSHQITYVNDKNETLYFYFLKDNGIWKIVNVV